MGYLEKTGRRSIAMRWFVLAVTLAATVFALIAFTPTRANMVVIALLGQMVGLDFAALLFGYHLERSRKC